MRDRGNRFGQAIESAIDRAATDVLLEVAAHAAASNPEAHGYQDEADERADIALTLTMVDITERNRAILQGAADALRQLTIATEFEEERSPHPLLAYYNYKAADATAFLDALIGSADAFFASGEGGRMLRRARELGIDIPPSISTRN